MFFLFQPANLPSFGRELERLEKALIYVRAVHPQMSIGALATLVALGRRQHEIWEKDKPLTEIAKEMIVPYNTLIRNTDLLGDGSKTIKGLRLIDKGISPSNRKERRILLTEAGVELLRNIEGALSLFPTEEEDQAVASLQEPSSSNDPT